MASGSTADPSTDVPSTETNLNDPTKQQTVNNSTDQQQQPLLTAVAPPPPTATAIYGPTTTTTAVTAIPSNNAVFDPYDRKYRCCCGCMHVRYGALTIGILELISACFAIFNYVASPYYYFLLIQMISYLLGIPAAICLIMAPFVYNQYLCIPYMIYGIIQFIVSLVVIIMIIVVLASGYEFAIAWGIALIISYLIAMAILAWFNWVVYGCYIYLRDRKNHIASGGVIMGRS